MRKHENLRIFYGSYLPVSAAHSRPLLPDPLAFTARPSACACAPAWARAQIGTVENFGVRHGELWALPPHGDTTTSLLMLLPLRRSSRSVQATDKHAEPVKLLFTNSAISHSHNSLFWNALRDPSATLRRIVLTIAVKRQLRHQIARLSHLTTRSTGGVGCALRSAQWCETLPMTIPTARRTRANKAANAAPSCRPLGFHSYKALLSW